MIGVFLKELRENVKWAAVMCGVMLFMFYREMRDGRPFMMFELAQRYTVAYAPICGLVMGVVQSLFETRPDNWAFVVHRPVARPKIFLAKCAAGLLLLYSALLLPCLLTALWASRVGHLVMPFQGRMILPMIADVLHAGGWYFAAMVVTLRRARWFGTRLLPVVLPLFGSFVLYLFIGTFWQAIVLILFVQLIGAAAAWGVFVSNGEGNRAPLTRLGLGAMIYPGAIGVLVFLAGLTQMFSSGGHWHYYQIDRDGNALRVTQTIDGEERRWSITDTSGNALPQYANADLDDPAYADLFLRFNNFLADERVIPWPMNIMYLNRNYRAATPGIVRLGAVAPANVKLPFAALYNVKQRIIELYDPVTRLPIGTVGPAGFASTKSSPAERFPGEAINLSSQGNRHVLAFDSIAYWIELNERRVRPIFHAEPNDPIYSACEFGPASDPIVVLATRQHLHVLKSSGRTHFSTPLDFDPSQKWLSVSTTSSSAHLLVQMWPLPGGQEKQPGALLEYGADGNLVRRTDLPPLPAFRGPKLYETVMFGAMFPLGARPICPGWILDEVIDIRSMDFAKPFEYSLIASAITCCALGILIARRCAFGPRKTIGWAVATLLLGPASIIVMLGLNDWPAREACTSCGRHRLIGRRECPRCAAALPPPKFDGREIFEPADAFAIAG